MAATVFSPLGRTKGAAFHHSLAPHTYAHTNRPQHGDAEPSKLGYTYADALHETTLAMAMPYHSEALF